MNITITPDSMRALSVENGSEDLAQRKLQEYEKTIASAARKGRRTALLDYVDRCNDAEQHAFRALRMAGFGVKKHTEIFAGVTQQPAWYAEW